MENVASQEFIEEVKKQWKQLWRERIDDKIRAEGIADTDYSSLFIEKGTVIFATRNFKMLNLREIIEMHGVADVNKVLPPSPEVGGWRKFTKTMILSQSRHRRAREASEYLPCKPEKQQLKKGGRGWLHL
ncbi:MAG: hypothetical protein QHH24_00925 [Candidatus Bathyarchaeota archaeon]|jgi:hypothetical protein|nr:hypothetical protein [Candidatus Bathyarchaeota archaeon]